MAEPQITAIASYFAARLPNGETPEPEAREAWRHALRYARETGAIEPLTEAVRSADPTDETLGRHCDDLRRDR